MLSAQCTDKRVNMTTPALFQAFPSSQALAQASFDEVYQLIRSISYPNSKAKHLISMAQMLEHDYNGVVPSTLEQLTRLPGVGRKTANVVMSVAFGKSTMAVDTHVFRVSHRIGLVPSRCTTATYHLTSSSPSISGSFSMAATYAKPSIPTVPTAPSVNTATLLNIPQPVPLSSKYFFNFQLSTIKVFLALPNKNP